MELPRDTATGTIRLPISDRGPHDERHWWMVLDVGPGWFLLYEHWMAKRAGGRWVTDRNGKLQWQNQQLHRPVWSNHISMVRGEEPLRNKAAWQHLEGRELRFQFDPDLGFNTTGPRAYWWLNVQCDQIGDIRESFGLDREPEFPLHLTLGTLR